jgi:cephalosporin hydroxylase
MTFFNVLAQRYQEVRSRPYDIVDHLVTLATAVLAFQEPVIVELGVRAGVSTVAWLWALQVRSAGHLWSVDGAHPVPDEFGNDLLSDQFDNPQWTFIQLWDNDPECLAQLPERCDILFVDSQHTYEVTSEELELYMPRVRGGGRAYFHDTALLTTGNAVTPQPPYPVRTAIEHYVARYPDLVFTNVENCNGLGRIDVPLSW